jgi:hypothetical protein
VYITSTPIGSNPFGNSLGNATNNFILILINIHYF